MGNGNNRLLPLLLVWTAACSVRGFSVGIPPSPGASRVSSARSSTGLFLQKDGSQPNQDKAKLSMDAAALDADTHTRTEQDDMTRRYRKKGVMKSINGNQLFPPQPPSIAAMPPLIQLLESQPPVEMELELDQVVIEPKQQQQEEEEAVQPQEKSQETVKQAPWKPWQPWKPLQSSESSSNKLNQQPQSPISTSTRPSSTFRVAKSLVPPPTTAIHQKQGKLVASAATGFMLAAELGASLSMAAGMGLALSAYTALTKLDDRMGQDPALPVETEPIPVDNDDKEDSDTLVIKAEEEDEDDRIDETTETSTSTAEETTTATAEKEVEETPAARPSYSGPMGMVNMASLQRSGPDSLTFAPSDFDNFPSPSTEMKSSTTPKEKTPVVTAKDLLAAPQVAMQMRSKQQYPKQDASSAPLSPLSSAKEAWAIVDHVVQDRWSKSPARDAPAFVPNHEEQFAPSHAFFTTERVESTDATDEDMVEMSLSTKDADMAVTMKEEEFEATTMDTETTSEAMSMEETVVAAEEIDAAMDVTDRSEQEATLSADNNKSTEEGLQKAAAIAAEAMAWAEAIDTILEQEDGGDVNLAILDHLATLEAEEAEIVSSVVDDTAAATVEEGVVNEIAAESAAYVETTSPATEETTPVIDKALEELNVINEEISVVSPVENEAIVTMNDDNQKDPVLIEETVFEPEQELQIDQAPATALALDQMEETIPEEETLVIVDETATVVPDVSAVEESPLESRLKEFVAQSAAPRPLYNSDGTFAQPTQTTAEAAAEASHSVEADSFEWHANFHQMEEESPMVARTPEAPHSVDPPVAESPTADGAMEERPLVAATEEESTPPVDMKTSEVEVTQVLPVVSESPAPVVEETPEPPVVSADMEIPVAEEPPVPPVVSEAPPTPQEVQAQAPPMPSPVVPQPAPRKKMVRVIGEFGSGGW